MGLRSQVFFSLLLRYRGDPLTLTLTHGVDPDSILDYVSG